MKWYLWWCCFECASWRDIVFLHCIVLLWCSRGHHSLWWKHLIFQMRLCSSRREWICLIKWNRSQLFYRLCCLLTCRHINCCLRLWVSFHTNPQTLPSAVTGECAIWNVMGCDVVVKWWRGRFGVRLVLIVEVRDTGESVIETLLLKNCVSVHVQTLVHAFIKTEGFLMRVHHSWPHRSISQELKTSYCISA